MILVDTPCGWFEIPNNYKDKTNTELLEILIEQYKSFLDPALVQLCLNKKLLFAGDYVEHLNARLSELKGAKR